MLLLLWFLPFSLFLVLGSAAPSSSSLSTSSSSISISSPSSHTSSAHRFLPTHHPHVQPSSPPHSIQIISRPTLPTPRTRFTGRPHPTGTTNHQGSQSNSGQKPIAIAFEVLAGLVGVAILIALLRCCYNYRRTPGRDRIAEILHRHQLQRELEEIERNPAVLRRPSLREPAPPYFPRPPSYDDLIPSPLSRGTAPSRTEYAPLATYSPPPSPPMSQRSLPASGVTAHHSTGLGQNLPSG
ncbi:hypothetical protein D9613_005164 [Agrocybe pediades]|uniref:Uncharacterized protein n=1 Tax=Agrocybe pediades TaxID=84607 RepID=A0A8H4VQM6_9AGAR|nr:hypothetical protein D9613_005164 [Agrocybe pediades]